MTTETIPTFSEQPTPETQKSWRTPIRRLAKCAVALTLAASAAAVAYAGDGIFREIGGAVALDEAPSPDVETLREVRDIINSPDDPELHKLKGPDQTVEFAIKAAEEQNLHLVDYRPYEARLKQSPDLDSSEQVFKAFMGRYGFKADIFGPIATDWRNFSAKPLEKKPELKGELDDGIRALMHSMFVVPVELAHATAVKEVALQSRVGSADHLYGGQYDPVLRRALFSLNDLVAPSLDNYDPTTHELVGHGIFRTSMESYNDPKAESLLKRVKQTPIREDQEQYGRTSVREFQAVTTERLLLGDLRDDRPAQQKMIILTLARLTMKPGLSGLAMYLRKIAAEDPS